jgi:hypothetical protein
LSLRFRPIDAETLFRHQPLEGLASAELIGSSAYNSDALTDRDPTFEGSIL